MAISSSIQPVFLSTRVNPALPSIRKDIQKLIASVEKATKGYSRNKTTEQAKEVLGAYIDIKYYYENKPLRDCGQGTGPDCSLNRDEYLLLAKTVAETRQFILTVILENDEATLQHIEQNNLNPAEYRRTNANTKRIANSLLDRVTTFGIQHWVNRSQQGNVFYYEHLSNIETILVQWQGEEKILGDEDPVFRDKVGKMIQESSRQRGVLESMRQFIPGNNEDSKRFVLEGVHPLDVMVRASLVKASYNSYNTSGNRYRFFNDLEGSADDLLMPTDQLRYVYDCLKDYSQKHGGKYQPSLYQIRSTAWNKTSTNGIGRDGNISTNGINDYYIVVNDGKSWYGHSVNNSYLVHTLKFSSQFAKKDDLFERIEDGGSPFNPTPWVEAVQVEIGDIDGDGKDDVYHDPRIHEIIRNPKGK